MLLGGVGVPGPLVSPNLGDVPTPAGLSQYSVKIASLTASDLSMAWVDMARFRPANTTRTLTSSYHTYN